MFRDGLEQMTQGVLSTQEADRLTRRAGEQGSWPFGAMLALANHGLQVTIYEDLAIERFMMDPASTIADSGADDAAILATDLGLEVDRASSCVRHDRIRFVERAPTLDDLDRALNDGAVITGLNAQALNGQQGYCGHFVVPTAFDGSVVTIDDPGGVPQPGRRVTADAFRTAWSSPSPRIGCLISVHRQDHP